MKSNFIRMKHNEKKLGKLGIVKGEKLLGIDNN